MRLAFVQFGSFAEAERRFAVGGAETFYAQRYSVEFLQGLAAKIEDLTVLHLVRDEPEERLPSGIRSLGIELFQAGGRPRYLEVIRALRRIDPDHVVVVSPLSFVIGWALLSGIRVLPLLADSFGGRGAKARAKTTLLAALLNNSRIDWVSNHNLAASLDLVRIGVAPEKVLPFDWPALGSPEGLQPKEPPTSDELRVVYVGQVTEEKGVGDLIEAVAILKSQGTGPRWRATIVGGTNEALVRRAEALGVQREVDFAGRVPHDRIVSLMSEHDAVVVPSWQEYPEGLPMTIYEALCSRTPLVVSDHRMFQLKLVHQESALIFPARQPARLAASLTRLARDGALYRRLSREGATAAADFFCPLKYDELISRWLSGGAEDRRILSTFSLASGRYDAILAKRGVALPLPSPPGGPLRSLFRRIRAPRHQFGL